MKDGGAFYIWHADTERFNFLAACQEADLQVRQVLVWIKQNFVMGRQDYQWRHEPCLYGWKDGAAHYFINDRTKTTVEEENARPNFTGMKKAELIELLEKIYTDKIQTTAIYEKRPSASELHPTMKPIPLIGRQIKNSSQKGELVLDTFAGSGSTMIAAEQLGRRSANIELDPHYCDVILTRWEQLTGREAKLK